MGVENWKKNFFLKKSPFISEPKFSDFCLKFIDLRQKSPLISAMKKNIFLSEFMDFWRKTPMIYEGQKSPKKVFSPKNHGFLATISNDLWRQKITKKNFFPENTRFSQELTIYFPSNKKSKKIHDFHSIGEQLTPPLISSLKRFLKFFFATIVKTLKNTTFGFEGGETFKIKFLEFSLIWGFSKKNDRVFRG